MTGVYMGIPELKTEIAYFEKHRKELLASAAGKFALIKGSECVGTFDTEDNAYKAGVEKFGAEPFLIQEIRPDDPVVELPSYHLGLLHASF